MKLYELTEDYQKALTELSEIEGLSDQCIADTLEGLKGELVDKAKNVAAYFQNLDSNAKELKAAEDRIKKRRVAMEKQSEGLKDYLRFNMEQSDINVIECPEFKVTLGKPSKIVEIIDIDMLDKEFVSVKITRAPDKKLIAAELKSGLEIVGARLIDGKSRLTIK